MSAWSGSPTTTSGRQLGNLTNVSLTEVFFQFPFLTSSRALWPCFRFTFKGNFTGDNVYFVYLYFHGNSKLWPCFRFTLRGTTPTPLSYWQIAPPRLLPATIPKLHSSSISLSRFNLALLSQYLLVDFDKYWDEQACIESRLNHWLHFCFLDAPASLELVISVGGQFFREIFSTGFWDTDLSTLQP